MGFGVSVTNCLRWKYATFEGRARRSEYWWFVLAYTIASFLAAALDAIFWPSLSEGPIYILLTLGILVPALAAAARRMHDTNRSGWWVLINIVPLVGSIVFMFLAIQDGTPGRNRFGPDPKGRNSGAETPASQVFS